MADAKRHWDTVYTTKGERDVSWFEAFPAVSLQMLEAAGVTPESCVLDVGGGDSRLVDSLAARGLTCLAVLDVSSAALERARGGIDKSLSKFVEKGKLAPGDREATLGRLTLATSLDALADADYVDRVGGGHFIPGPARQVTATADLHF